MPKRLVGFLPRSNTGKFIRLLRQSQCSRLPVPAFRHVISPWNKLPRMESIVHVRARSLCMLMALMVASGCVESHPNADCAWPSENHNRGLYYDAEFAEDLAIRYADAHSGPRSGHFEGFAEYWHTRDRCMALLFSEVARAHGVDEDQVRRALTARPLAIDAIIALPYVLLYTLASNAVVSRIHERRRGQELASASMVMVAYISIVTSAAGVLIGEAWSGIAETIRLNNGHLSYRTDRNPWAGHYPILFIAALALFWCVFALRTDGCLGLRILRIQTRKSS
jgi:hypothetical protein